jgi:putative colanic acid biosynthesis acetyltransferase WcaF
MNLSWYDNSDFDRGAPRWKEALWIGVRCVFFQNPLPWPSRLRRALLRVFGAHVGRGVTIKAGVNVSFPWRLRVGDHVWIGEEVNILSLAIVLIESNVCVSQQVFLCTGSHDYRRDNFPLIVRPITIRTGSWIAARSFVGPGVEVGAGSVVGAASAVLASVPEFCLVRGNPAQTVRRLNVTSSDPSDGQPLCAI